MGCIIYGIRHGIYMGKRASKLERRESVEGFHQDQQWERTRTRLKI